MKKKIYRLEIWAALDNRNNWAYRPLSGFYADKSCLEKIRQEMLQHYDELDKKCCYFEDGTPNDNGVSELFREWEKYLSGYLCLTGNAGHNEIVDTHANMPDINEYVLYE